MQKDLNSYIHLKLQYIVYFIKNIYIHTGIYATTYEYISMNI